jgi:succinate-semialdehyde dehydrogenase/glutarate-semialdehyde dehydrogenase
VLNVLTTSSSAAVSEPIIADRRLRKLSFTGSTGVGRRLLVQAAQNVLRTSMELGANAPFIVFGDADLDKAVDGAMAAKFRNIGQACTAANRFIVHRSIADDFARRLTDRVAAMPVGRGTESGATIGPFIDARAVDTVDSLVQDALARGATLRTGGRRVPRAGSFYEPTVIGGVVPGSAILNAGVISNAAAPCGGVKQSGLSREGGAEGIHEYLSTKYTMLPVG